MQSSIFEKTPDRIRLQQYTSPCRNWHREVHSIMEKGKDTENGQGLTLLIIPHSVSFLLKRTIFSVIITDRKVLGGKPDDS